jgi:hypothetical protein
MKIELAQLSWEVKIRKKLVAAGMIRAEIIQAIILGDIHLAGEKYKAF